MNQSFDLKSHFKEGFTLIELSIVLVIIGFIAGGVLVGQYLINASAMRAQISQIERYNNAANTFQDKYGYLPGDIPNPYATQAGFKARGTTRGTGDGNGALEGNGGIYAQGVTEYAGETTLFWVDLSMAHMIDGGFSTAAANSGPTLITATSTPNFDAFFPAAKLGGGNYIYVWSGGIYTGSSWLSTGVNYFELAALSQITSSPQTFSTPALTVQQAYLIDQKVDDGMPQTGRVITQYVNSQLSTTSSVWAAGGGNYGTANTNATPGSATTCFDNSSASSGTPGVAGAMQHYSLEISNGNNVNCALAFRFQGGED